MRMNQHIHSEGNSKDDFSKGSMDVPYKREKDVYIKRYCLLTCKAATIVAIFFP